MSRIRTKFIKWGTAAGDVNASAMPANRTATNYTPTDTSVKGHLDGIDTALVAGVSGDIALTSFSAANNQVAAANVTGFAFANGTVRSFRALVSVAIDATSDLFEQFTIDGIQKSASWEISVVSVGDNSGITFSITSAGQIQYTSSNVTGFVSNTIKFRAQVTTI